MICLVGTVCIGIAVMNGGIADNPYLMVVLAGRLADPAVLVEQINLGFQIAAIIQSGPFAKQLNHKFQSLASFDHRSVVFLLTNQPLCITDTLLDSLPAGIGIVCHGNLLCMGMCCGNTFF